MEKNQVLDIWAVQQSPHELYTALKYIKDDVIIFKNVICKFKIGNRIINSRQFDTVIYSENSDIMIMLARGGKATSEMAEKYLDEHGIEYNIVNFIELPAYEYDENVKTFWFAREQYVLEQAIDDSIEGGHTNCKYDPYTKSKIYFKYQLSDGSDAPMIKISFKGFIEFEDKYILPTLSTYQENLHKDDIYKVLQDKNVQVETFDINNDLLI